MNIPETLAENIAEYFHIADGFSYGTDANFLSDEEATERIQNIIQEVLDSSYEQQLANTLAHKIAGCLHIAASLGYHNCDPDFLSDEDATKRIENIIQNILKTSEEKHTVILTFNGDHTYIAHVEATTNEEATERAISCAVEDSEYESDDFTAIAIYSGHLENKI